MFVGIDIFTKYLRHGFVQSTLYKTLKQCGLNDRVMTLFSMKCNALAVFAQKSSLTVPAHF